MSSPAVDEAPTHTETQISSLLLDTVELDGIKGGTME